MQALKGMPRTAMMSCMDEILPRLLVQNVASGRRRRRLEGCQAAAALSAWPACLTAGALLLSLLLSCDGASSLHT